jgi:hypothetical protein
MEYLQWNTLLTKHFFSPDRAGRKVYLFATREIVEQFGQSHNADFADFISAVKMGPGWVRANGLCQKALQVMSNWQSRSRIPALCRVLGAFCYRSWTGRRLCSECLRNHDRATHGHNRGLIFSTRCRLVAIAFLVTLCSGFNRNCRL